MPDSSLFIPDDVPRRPAPLSGRGYRYLSVDASTMKITNEFELTGVSYSFQRNAPGEFAAGIDLYSNDTTYLVPQATYLVVERLGVPFWCGFLWQPVRQDKMLQVQAQGVWSIFGHRHVRDTKSYFNTNRGTAMRDLVDYAQLGAGGDVHVATGSELSLGDPLPEYVINWWDDKIVGSEVEALALMDPACNFRIEGKWNPGNILDFNFILDPVHPRPTPHRLVYGSNVDDYDYAPLTPSPNFVDAFGGFDGPAMLRRSAQNDDALLTQPRIELSVGNRDWLVEDPVTAMALGTVKRFSGSPAQPTVAMQGSADPQLGTLIVGDQVEVDISDGPYIQIHGDYIIEKMVVAVPDGSANTPGAETVGLEFESIVPDGSVSAL